MLLVGTHAVAFGAGVIITRAVMVRRLKVCEAQDGHLALELRHDDEAAGQ